LASTEATCATVWLGVGGTYSAKVKV
jgi:hypothetical protein